MADHLVSEALYLTDPDGLGIEVYADRPRALEIYLRRLPTVDPATGQPYTYAEHGFEYDIRVSPAGEGVKLQVVFEVFQMNPVMITIIGREVLDPLGVGVARTLGNCLSMSMYALLAHHLGPDRTLDLMQPTAYGF